MHYLLDKNIIRHAITALRDARKRPLLPLELGALSFWQADNLSRAIKGGHHIKISGSLYT